MLKTRRFGFSGAVISAAAISAMPAAAGSITLESQDREASISIVALSDLIFETNTDSINQTVSAPDFGPFAVVLDETIDAEDPEVFLDQLSSARATQNSSFTEAGSNFVAAATGTSRYSSEGTDQLTFADSDFEVVFTVDSPTDYILEGEGYYTDGASGAGGFSVNLFQTTYGDVYATNGFADSGPDFDGMIETVAISDSGTLAAGTYTFRLTSGVSGGVTGGSVVDAGYDVSLTLVNTAPTPAALPAGLMLGSMLLTRRRR